MPLFAVVGIDHPSNPVSARESVRPQHRAYVLAHDAPIRFAGSMVNDADRQCGSLLIFEANSADEVRTWFGDEPFFRTGVYRDFHVLELRLALNAFEPTGGWVQNYDKKPAMRANG